MQFEGAPDGSDFDPEDIPQWLLNPLIGKPFSEDQKQGRENFEMEQLATY